MAFTSNSTFIPWDPLRAMKSAACAACGSANAKSKCGACQFAKYCGVECQRAHWSDHAPLCKRGYNGYVEQLEKHQKRISPFILASDDEGAIQCYTEALAAARAFGDSEGVRHNLHAIAHRCDAKARTAEAAKYKAEADQLEQILGKPSSAKQIFSRLDGLPSMQTDLPEQLSALAPRQAGKSAPPPRGAKRGTLPWCEWEQSISDVTITVKLPSGVQRQSLAIDFGRQGLRVALKGGVVVADVELGGRIMPDECTWTLGDGAACLTLEKAERKVWDYLLSQPPAPPLPPSNASAASSALPSSSSPADLAAAAAPYLGVDISETDDRAAQVTAALSGLAVADPSAAARLMCAAASSHVAPPKPPPLVATGPTEQAASPPRTGGDTGHGCGS